MIILAIDPGTEKSAFVKWDTETSEILHKGIEDNISLLCSIGEAYFDHVAIEMVAS